MRESIRCYIEGGEHLLSFRGICWWLIDYAKDPEYFYCNETMVELFGLELGKRKHSVARTCPIAGDYNRNVALASEHPAIANKIFDDYVKLVRGEIDEYSNVFPYYSAKYGKTLYFASRAKVLEWDDEGNPAILFGIIEDITSFEEQRQRLRELNEELAQLSVTDKLTGLYNRHHLNEVLTVETNRAECSNRNGTFGVVLLDIDHFKRINDRYGHNTGDRVLVGVAEVIRRNVRSIDTVGRWGGEEFLVICPRIDREGIHRLAERLRSCLESVTLAAGALVTVCCGVALHRRGESVEQLIGRADQALYRAKDQGRNRVMIA